MNPYKTWLGIWANFGISWPSAALESYRESRYSSLGQPARAMMSRFPNREFSLDFFLVELQHRRSVHMVGSPAWRVGRAPAGRYPAG